MKQYILSFILLSGILFGISFDALAVKAYPHPITVTQPDGSTITIRVHGDEFLNWTTCGNNLVASGKDGFYYYARFLPDGRKELTGTRVSTAISVPAFGNGSTIMPPASAIQRANMMKSGMRRMGAPSAASITQGSNHFLIILIEFPDLPFTVEDANAKFHSMANDEGYSDNGGTGSIRDYYSDNSNNAFNPNFDVVGPVCVSHGYAYYGENDNGTDPDKIGARDLLIEACDILDATLDFSQYDIDKNGYIDNVFFYFAGHNAAEGAEGDVIWPHQWSVPGTHIYDGVRLYGYACTSEYRGASGTNMCGIGTFCHEFGHVLGLPDFYDTDGDDNGNSDGIGSYSLMSGGNYNNGGKTPPYLSAMERNILGWMGKPTELTSSGFYTTLPVQNNFAYYTTSNNPGEYYIYEARTKKGWDKYLPGSGLLIYHVDQSNNIVNGMTAKDRWRYGDGINSVAKHQCYDLIKAGTIQNEASWPFGSYGKTSFTSETSPPAILWDGTPSGFNLTNITIDNDNVTFDLAIQSSVTIKGTVINSSGKPVGNAVVSFESIDMQDRGPSPAPRLLRSIQASSASERYETVTDSQGMYSIDIDNGGTFSQVVSAEGYAPYTNTIEAKRGVVTYDVTLVTPIENLYHQLVKYDGINTGSTIGITRKNTFSGSCAVGYEASELTGYVGYSLKEITYMVIGTSAEKIEVFVLFDGVEQLRKEVVNPVFGTLCTVDIGAENLIIPENTNVMFGYELTEINHGHPICSDDGPMKHGGFLISFDNVLWEDILEASNHKLDCNVIISATIRNNDNIFRALGYNAISVPKTTFAVGEIYVPRIAMSANEPHSISFTFDGKTVAEGERITLEAGEHVIEAVLVYANGAKETLTQEILVK